MKTLHPLPGMCRATLALISLALISGCGGSGGSSSSPNAPAPITSIGNQTQFATSVTESSDGRIVVTDTKGNDVDTYDSTGKLISTYPIATSGVTLDEPEGLAFDNAGNMYIGDTTNRRILKVAPNGTLLLTVNKGAVPMLMLDSEGITVDSIDKLLYVADVATHRVEVFNSDTGAWIRNIPQTGTTAGSAPGEFHTPLSVVTDAAGNLYVADSLNNRIQKFDSSGNFILAWGTEGTAQGQFKDPVAVTIDGAGSIYVYDSLNSRIQAFKQDGTWIKTILVKPHKTVSEQETTGLYVDTAHIYLVNFDTGKVDLYPLT